MFTGSKVYCIFPINVIIGFTVVTLQELCDYLDQVMDAQSFSDYSVNGIHIEGAQNIKKIATAVSASLALCDLRVSVVNPK